MQEGGVASLALLLRSCLDLDKPAVEERGTVFLAWYPRECPVLGKTVMEKRACLSMIGEASCGIRGSSYPILAQSGQSRHGKASYGGRGTDSLDWHVLERSVVEEGT